MRKLMRIQLSLLLSYLLICLSSYSQPCTTPGQTPSTAIEVCGSTTFIQSTVPICKNNILFVPGCSSGINTPDYDDRNPFWYRFICSTSGTLGFLIDPHADDEDFDWQLFDITGHNPEDVYTDTSLVVAGNWAGSFGNTGASNAGFPGINCASEYVRFAIMPYLIEGHEYLLLISHFAFSGNENGYTLSFGGGTAVITDPGEPHLQTAIPNCSGKTISLKLDRKVRCSSLTAIGTEFSLSPAMATVVAAAGNNCSGGSSFDEVIITLSNPIPNGSYVLTIHNGSDGNTLLGYCNHSVPEHEQVSFQYNTPQPQPIFADSIGRPACSPMIKTVICDTLKRLQAATRSIEQGAA